MKKNPPEIKHGRGGPRPGAGRPRGAHNKASAAREAEIKASGATPLEHMLGVMRDPAAEPPRRDDMAKAAAPYVHPRVCPAESALLGAGFIGLTIITGVPHADSKDGRAIVRQHLPKEDQPEG